MVSVRLLFSYLPQHPDVGLKDRDNDVRVKSHISNDPSNGVLKVVNLTQNLENEQENSTNDIT